MNGHGLPFYLGLGAAGAQLARVIWRTEYDNRDSCWKGFVGCGWFGVWIWCGAMGDWALRTWNLEDVNEGGGEQKDHSDV